MIDVNKRIIFFLLIYYIKKKKKKFHLLLFIKCESLLRTLHSYSIFEFGLIPKAEQ